MVAGGGRRVVRDLLRRHHVDERVDVVAVAAECWRHPGFDSRRAAFEVLHARRTTLGPDDFVMLEAIVIRPAGPGAGATRN